MEKKTQRKNKDRRVEMSVEGLKEDFAWHLRYSLAKGDERATDRDRYTAFANAVRDRLVERWISTQEEYSHQNTKRVYYMSLEFLIGRLLGNNVINLKADQLCRDALEEYGINWNDLRDYETDAGLGNGGLGRLAACYIDSMSTLNLAGMGYGLRYDYGIFRQRIVNGCQVEEPDHWLKDGYPWEMARPEYAQHVHFGGHVECRSDHGRQQWYWIPAETVQGVPYDLPIVGYDKAVNSLRLWSAKAVDDFDLADFDKGSYVEAVEQKVLAENLTKVLYPNDNTTQGKELRLRQQYFFVACSLRDILRRFRQTNESWDALPDKVFIQLNDTHPTLVIPELMRVLIDVEGLDWDKAWDLTRRSTGYTNHTILQEALEKWPVPMMERLLPRHLQIIYEINGRFLQEISSLYPGDIKKLQRMSLIDEGGTPRSSSRRSSRTSTSSGPRSSTTSRTASRRAAGSSRPTRRSRSSSPSRSARAGSRTSTTSGSSRSSPGTTRSSPRSRRSSPATSASSRTGRRRTSASSSTPTRSTTSR